MTVRRRPLFHRYTISHALNHLESIGALEGALPMKEAVPAAPPPERFVNTIVAVTGTTQPVPADSPLAPDSSYDVLVNIGQYIDGSLLDAENASWPEVLPEGVG